MKVQLRPESQMFLILKRLSGKPGIVCARVVLGGKFCKLRFVAIFDDTKSPFATFTLIPLGATRQDDAGV